MALAIFSVAEELGWEGDRSVKSWCSKEHNDKTVFLFKANGTFDWRWTDQLGKETFVYTSLKDLLTNKNFREVAISELRIGGHLVTFANGVLKVGCTEVTKAQFRTIQKITGWK